MEKEIRGQKILNERDGIFFVVSKILLKGFSFSHHIKIYHKSDKIPFIPTAGRKLFFLFAFD